ncbi:hypothetical protein IC617_07525 [Neiella sp. HB171785]|uniref:Uncharacterized protein n=1 Tax=Neiella litorisoli TaxID=2771431 RepID=A0A8J6QGW9_9GAMM|nr:hypothetical protein [Neiella litorisoli]MBD1389270.1 hypothetical protein [Neiella litorisoli]
MQKTFCDSVLAERYDQAQNLARYMRPREVRMAPRDYIQTNCGKLDSVELIDHFEKLSRFVDTLN